jgi:uncharacterized protein YkwD
MGSIPEELEMKTISVFRFRIMAILFALMLIFSQLPNLFDVSSEVEASKYGNIAPTSFELQLLDKINENRSNNGAGPLVFNSTLMWVARAHSQDMIDYDFFNHTSSVEGQFNGATFGQRVKTYAEYKGSDIGECIAKKGWGIDVEDTMDGWKNSPPHWAIIIDPEYTEIGLGLLEGEWNGTPGVGLHTADFGNGSISVDLSVNPSDMDYSPSSPAEGVIVNISAVVHNQGLTDAYPVTVKFYDGDPDSGGTQIGTEQQVTHILVQGESATLNVLWDTTGKGGSHDIYVKVDPANIISESNEGNNKAYKTIFVNAPIHLEQGWNLVSFPYIVMDASLANVLTSISGEYDSVQYYNASDMGDPWKHFAGGKSSTLNDLADLDNKKGFWIHITEVSGVDLAVPGTLPSSPQTIQLKKGWNMVGYPSSTARARTVALNNLEVGVEIDIIQFYDTASGRIISLGSGDDMEPGMGYWIHANQACDWIVNP